MNAPLPSAGSPGRPRDADLDVVVIGGGQAGLAAGFYLRRAGLDFVILDDADQPGGAWARMWPSLRAFSPPEYSSLPGWLMPRWTADEGFPPREHVVDYLTRYEQRYELPVRRPVRVHAVQHPPAADTDDPNGPLLVRSDRGAFRTRAVISATGTWSRPFQPRYPGMERFAGVQLHSAQYRSAQDWAGARVVIVGGGNTAAQLLAEISLVARTTWVTPRPPRFMPDDVDGRVLFTAATARRRAIETGTGEEGGVPALGDIVMVPAVRRARERGVLVAQPMFNRLTTHGIAWADDREQPADVVLWCTGYRPALSHLSPLGLRNAEGVIDTDGTQAIREPRLQLLGYGDWTGLASATLIGVGRPARDAVRRVREHSPSGP